MNNKHSGNTKAASTRTPPRRQARRKRTCDKRFLVPNVDTIMCKLFWDNVHKGRVALTVTCELLVDIQVTVADT